MLQKIKSALFACLSATLPAFAAAPVEAAPSNGLCLGHGTYLAPNQDVVELSHFVSGLPGGSAHGSGVWSGPGGATIWSIESMMMLSDGETLAIVGTILAVIGTSGPGHEVGLTAFTGFKDHGTTDETLGLSPAFLGNLTIQQIVGLIGEPPPQAYKPVVSGNVFILSAKVPSENKSHVSPALAAPGCVAPSRRITERPRRRLTHQRKESRSPAASQGRDPRDGPGHCTLRRLRTRCGRNQR